MKGSVEQVWFAGVHSSVGGGYPRGVMSNAALIWKSAGDPCVPADVPTKLERAEELISRVVPAAFEHAVHVVAADCPRQSPVALAVFLVTWAVLVRLVRKCRETQEQACAALMGVVETTPKQGDAASGSPA